MDSRQARQRIDAAAPLNIYISLTDEEGDGPVVAVKDLIDVRGTVTTAGSVILPRVPAEEDAPVIRAIRSHGACVIGKTSTHEFACGVTNENPHYGPVHNPRDPSRIPGGSSGGSAAAVAAGTCDWAIGTDTGGSVRIPASLCGVASVKPTIGAVNTAGIIPLSWTLDTVGPLAPDVETAARALEMMSGLADLVPNVVPDCSDLRLAIPSGWVDELDEETQAVWDRVRQGLPEIPLPDRAGMLSAFQTIFFVEASTNHRQWIEKCPEKYGTDVLSLVRRGLDIAAVDYAQALCRIEPYQRALEEALSGWDAVLLPASAIVAPKIGTPHVREKLLRFTRPFSLTGHPVITVPMAAGGLPVGVQVIGHFGGDHALIQVARALELTMFSAER